MLLTIPVGSALATVSLSTVATYSGTEQDTQAIEVEISLSPDGSRITDATLQVTSTSQTFIDFESFETTLRPGDAEINLTYQGSGEFTIGELQPNEEVTIRFNAYPQTIKQQTLDTVSVDLSYIQNGQKLSTSNTVSTDLSSSPWFTLQEAQSQIKQLQAVGIGGGVLGVIGLGSAGFMIYRGRKENGDDDEPFGDEDDVFPDDDDTF